MLTGKGLTILGGAIILLFLGLYFFEYQIIVIALFFLIFIILSKPILPEDVIITRRTPEIRIFEGDELNMTLLVGEKNTGKKNPLIYQSYNLIEMSDKLPGYTSLASESNHKIFHLPGKHLKKLSYKIFCPIRGFYSIGPVNLRLTDNSQLFYYDIIKSDLYQFPVNLGYKTIKRFDLPSKAFDWNFGQNLLNIQGKSSDFYSIRDYTKQDSYREINWKATAKKQKLMVNTFERETLSDCCIFLDARDITNVGRPHDNFIEYSVRLAFGLAKTVIKNNNRLSIITYNDMIQLIPPGLGMNHTANIHAMLINTQAKGFLPFYAALLYAWPFLKPKSTIIIFSPMEYDDTLFSSIISLQRMDMKIIVVTSSIITFESRAIQKTTERNDLDSERRRNQIHELERWGVSVITWEPGDNFELILKKINSLLNLKEGRFIEKHAS